MPEKHHNDREHTLYNPDFFSEDAITLKNSMLDSFIHAAGLVPQTFVYVTPVMMQGHAERNLRGYSKLLYTQLTPEEKRKYGKKLEKSRDSAHYGEDIPKRRHPSTSFDLYDGLYKNIAVNSSENAYVCFSASGISDEHVIALTQWLRLYYLENKDTLREYKKALSLRAQSDLGSTPKGRSPHEILQELVNDASMIFKESELYSAMAQEVISTEVLDGLLDDLVFPHQVTVG